MALTTMQKILGRADQDPDSTIVRLHSNDYHFDDGEPHDPMTAPLPESLDEMELVIRRLQNDNVDLEASMAKLENQRTGNDALLARFRQAFSRRALELGAHPSLASEEIE